MRVDDVVLLEYGAPGSRALGVGNFETFSRHYLGRKTSQDLKLDMGNDNMLIINDSDVPKLVNYYNDLPSTENKKDFVYNVMSREGRLIPLLERLSVKYQLVSPPAPEKPQKPYTQQPGLFEANKKDEPELTRYSVKDPKLSVALRKAYAKQPSAASDIEALIRSDIDAQATTQDELDKQVSVNQRQQRNIETLRDLARKQSELLKNLDSENSDQDRELSSLDREIRDIAGRAVGRAEEPGYVKSRLRAPSLARDKDADKEPVDSKLSTADEPETVSTKKSMPFEPTTGGAPVSPRSPQGPGPRSGGAIGQLSYEPKAGPLSTAVGRPVSPSQSPAPLEEPPIATTATGQDIFRSRQPKKYIDILPDVPDYTVTDVDIDREVPGRIGQPASPMIDRFKTLAGLK